jgi:hypothetical protein
VIYDALAWRAAPSDEGVDHAATFPTAVRFVEFAGDYMALEPALGAAEGDEQKADHADDAQDEHDVKET